MAIRSPARNETSAIHAGDGVVVVGRTGQAINAMFEAPREKVPCRPADVLDDYRARVAAVCLGGDSRIRRHAVIEIRSKEGI